MTLHILLLILGLVLVIGGGNYVTEGAVSLAGRMHLSPMLIGLTVVAFGSSTPDLVVSVFSTLHGKYDLAVGNILGAVIFDMLLVVGIMAMMRPLRISRSTLYTALPVMTLGAFIVFLCGQDKLFDPKGQDVISRVDGIVMLLVFVVFMLYTIKLSQHKQLVPDAASHPKVVKQQKAAKPRPLWLALVMIAGGLAALVYGGEWTVDAASAIARRAGMSEALIGLTIVGIGSSLPDLATSIIAALKGENGLALGNIVGSCIMDILMVIGACAALRPLAVAGMSVVDFAVLAGSALLLLLIGLISKKHEIGRGWGVVLLLLYITYMAYLVFSSR